MEINKYEGIVTEWKKILPGYCGYMRLYYRGKTWYPGWFPEDRTTDLFSAEAHTETNALCRELAEHWPGGCNYQMCSDVKTYKAEIRGSHGRYLLETESDDFRFLIYIDIRYGDLDYPIRVHTYRKGFTEDVPLEGTEGKRKDCGLENWQLTNSEACQLVRKKEEGVYELYRAEAVDQSGDSKVLFGVAHAIIRIEEINLEEVFINYGYNTLEELKADYDCGGESYLAECCFEFNAKKHMLPSEDLTLAEAVERILNMSGYQPEKPIDDDKFMQFMEKVQVHDVGHYHFQYMRNDRKGVIMTSDNEYEKISYVIFCKEDFEELTTEYDLPLKICDVCGSVMNFGWTDEFGDTYFCTEEEFTADMDERYGAGNWRAEPTGKFDWSYEYRKGPGCQWLPEPSFYTEW
ncbi:hypothetical protein QMP26_41660 (plasmid) [Enterocloster clostridioformis]